MKAMKAKAEKIEVPRMSDEFIKVMQAQRMKQRRERAAMQRKAAKLKTK